MPKDKPRGETGEKKKNRQKTTMNRNSQFRYNQRNIKCVTLFWGVAGLWFGKKEAIPEHLVQNISLSEQF